MKDEKQSVPALEFSEKYSEGHAQQYYDKHEDGFWRRVSNRREIEIARQGLKLAGDPKSVLDMPCGAGRFWAMLAEAPDRKLWASDYNQTMLDVAERERPAELVGRFERFQASAFDIPKPDGFVECVFCMRLLHHLGKKEDRLKLLREFHRVSSKFVVISLWVDGNFKAWKRRKMERKREIKTYQNRFVQPREAIESEMRECGFDIAGHVDFMKFYSMWRVYVLKKR